MFFENTNSLNNLITGSQTQLEKTTSVLRGLFALNGYKRYEMSSFESYELYHEHRDFLKSAGIITFNDMHGRLKALKPDVTMSIIKHTATHEKQSKLYYIENVFRTLNTGSDIREISQMGVEFLGGDALYAEAEIIDLAVKCLEVIDKDYILSISHAAFVTSFINSLNLQNSVNEEILKAISEKNSHSLLQIAKSVNCSKKNTDILIAFANISGSFNTVLNAFQNYICTQEMQNAFDLLSQINKLITNMNIADKIRLDFCALSAQDAKYYNGIILQGYIKGISKAVLTGGRYDNLMHFFGKPQGAIGFAITLSELGRKQSSTNDYDFDIALVYNENCSANDVIKAMHTFQKEGKSVYTINKSKLPLTVKVKQNYILNEDGQVSLC